MPHFCAGSKLGAINLGKITEMNMRSNMTVTPNMAIGTHITGRVKGRLLYCREKDPAIIPHYLRSL